MTDEQPTTALPPAYVGVSEHGTRYNGEFNGLWLFLTFAALYTNELTSLAAVVETLDRKAFESKGRHVTCWVVSREVHANPADPERCDHLHVLIRYGTRVALNNVHNFWDLEGRPTGVGAQLRCLHPYIIIPANARRDLKLMLRYILKDGNAFMRLGSSLPDLSEPVEEEDWADAIQAIVDDHGTMADAMQMLRENYLKIYLTMGTRIMPMMKRLFLEAEPSYFTIDQFTANDILPEITSQHKCLILTGATNCGKTSYALALSPAGKTLIVRCRDDLRRFAPQFHTKIVFDDFALDSWLPEEALALTTVEHTASIKCLYGSVIIPPKFPRVFTTNLPACMILPRPRGAEQLAAMMRRLHIVEVRESLFVVDE